MPYPDSAPPLIVTDPSLGSFTVAGIRGSVAIIFRAEQSVAAIGAETGDLIVIDLDDQEFPVSLVRSKRKEQLLGVLRHLDSFRLLTPEASLSPLFGAVGLEQPLHAPEQHVAGRPAPPGEEAS